MSSSADIIITNAKIFTSDADKPRAEVIAIKDKRIIYVGANEGVKEFGSCSPIGAREHHEPYTV